MNAALSSYSDGAARAGANASNSSAPQIRRTIERNDIVPFTEDKILPFAKRGQGGFLPLANPPQSKGGGRHEAISLKTPCCNTEYAARNFTGSRPRCIDKFGMR